MNKSIGPTRETQAKLRTSVISKLAQAGRLDAFQRQAADEIATIYMAVIRSLMPHRDFDAVVVDGGGASYATPLERMPAKVYDAYTHHYRPWAKGAGTRLFTRDVSGGRVTVLQLVIDVAVENWGPSQLETRYGVPRGKSLVTKTLQAALNDYCQTAGWHKPT